MPVAAIPDTGYHFTDWSDGLANNPRVDTGNTQPLSVTASFLINQYTLTYNAGAYGELSGITTQTVNHGDNGSAVSALPETGYHFVKWSDGVTDNPRTDLYIEADLEVTAEFDVNLYTFTFTNAEGGAVACGMFSIYDDSIEILEIAETRSWELPYGCDIIVAQLPAQGYRFDQWSGTGSFPCGGSEEFLCSFPLTEPTTAQSAFVRQYSATFTANGEGTVTVASPGTAGSPWTVGTCFDASPTLSLLLDAGTSLSVTAQSVAGCYFNGWAEPSLQAMPSTFNLTLDSDLTITGDFGCTYDLLVVSECEG